MLCRNNYSQKYIGECRKKVEHQVSAYKNLAKVAADQKGTKLNAAIEAFESVFFNNMVLALKNYFVHRSRTIEQKEGNALNEVRMLSNSMMNNNNILTADNTIKYKPENTGRVCKVI